MRHDNINITLCDDERTEIAYLAGLVRKWAAGCNVNAHLSEYTSAESLLFAYEDDKTADILLLDIQMGAMDGVALAKELRRDNKEIQIIFVTGYMEYIADGYDVEALHYLLKPVTEEKLSAVLDKAVQKLTRNERALFVCHTGENVRIPLYEIRFLEVFHNYVTIHAQGDYIVKKTLGELERELERELDSGFFRTGRSHLVNLRYVRKTTKSEIFLMDGSAIPLSRGLFDAINRAIIERL